jgi:rhodanese-related sulfurtransferase
MKASFLKSALPLAMIVTALLFAGPAHALFGKDKFEKEVETEASAVKLAKETLDGGYKVMNVDELKAMMDENKDMLIIDTMPYETSYKDAHIPGAKQFLFPIEIMSDWDNAKTDGKSVEDFKAMLGSDMDKPIVIYCGFTKCTRSHNGAMWAVKLGYTNVYRQPGGIFAWKGKDYPAESVK